MDSSHFSTLINDFKPGIFGALNEKRKNFFGKEEKSIICRSGHRISGRRLM